MKDRTCRHCQYFDDYSATEPDDEVNGYCTWAFFHDKSNEHGGHWSHTDSTCENFTEGPSIWRETPTP